MFSPIFNGHDFDEDLDSTAGVADRHRRLALKILRRMVMHLSAHQQSNMFIRFG